MSQSVEAIYCIGGIYSRSIEELDLYMQPAGLKFDVFKPRL
jgi:hypothetical protein